MQALFAAEAQTIQQRTITSYTMAYIRIIIARITEHSQLPIMYIRQHKQSYSHSNSHTTFTSM